jgi:hypothetical protein
MSDFVIQDADIPSDVKNADEYRETVQAMRPKLYEIAREYWRKVNDETRLMLTDEELNDQFWLIDHNGIPRLKSEMNSVQLPPDPLEALIGLIETDISDLSETTREDIDALSEKHNGAAD